MIRFAIRSSVAVTTFGLLAAALGGPILPASANISNAPRQLPASTKSVPRFSPLYMSYRAQAPITMAEATRLGRSYDVIAAAGTSLKPYMGMLRKMNPKIIVAGYVNGMYSPDADNHPEAEYSHSLGSRRISTYQFGQDLMNPASAAWRGEIVADCRAMIATSGYDGCFLDNLGQAPFNTDYVTAEPINPATHAVWTPGAWTRATSALAASVVNGVPGKVVFGNGLMNGYHYFNPEGATAPLSAVTSSAMAELFLRGPTADVRKFPSETAWKQNVNMIADAEARGHRVLVTTKVWLARATGPQIAAWHQYALGSFLIGSSGGSFFNFSGAQTADALTSDNSWDAVAIGDPAGRYAKIGNVYSRLYQHGLVLVNPTKLAGSYALKGTYTTLVGTRVSGTRTLKPGSALVLRKAS